MAKLLIDPRQQEKARNGVLWIDEASLLGARSMARLFKLAGEIGARIVLAGDTRQHGPVDRGAPMALLEREAGLRPAELKEIRRQKDDYLRAVRALSQGDVESGFRQLDRLGWIREVDHEHRHSALAADYVAALEKGSALIVAPTHREGSAITTKVREELKAKGKLGNGRTVMTLTPLHLTLAERSDAANLTPGDVVVLNQNLPGHTRGERLMVGLSEIPSRHPDRFEVFRSGELEIAAGDLVRFTHGGRTKDGAHRLENGATYRVAGFTKDGDIRLENKWIVDRDFGFLTHGFCVTSHVSQSRTVDRVFIGQSADFGAASAQQFYVSVSRGRNAATIYTDDKHALLDAVHRSELHETATDLVKGSRLRKLRQRAARVRRAAPEIERLPYRQHELERG